MLRLPTHAATVSCCQCCCSSVLVLHSRSSFSCAEICSSGNIIGVIDPLPCTPGRYCLGNATTLWGHGPCAAGYVCPAGSSTATPAATKCPAGWFCGAGSSSPSSLCAPGYYCVEGSTSARANLCPAGYYCFAGSSEPVPCPPGSWSSTTGRSASCNLCPAATYNPESAATNYTACLECPRGFYCPSAGLMAALPCAAGFMSAPSGLACVECPVGTYNPLPGNNASSPCAPCPVGHVCKAGTAYPEGE